MAQLVQVVNSQASVYALQGNQWQERGQGGQLMLYYYSNSPHDLLVRWWKAGQSLAFQLVHGKLKPKGERSWVLRAYNMSYNPPREEIIALRFHFEEASEVFCNHYKQVSSHVILQKSKNSNFDVEDNIPDEEIDDGPSALKDKSGIQRPPSQPLPPPPPSQRNLPLKPEPLPSKDRLPPQGKKQFPSQENLSTWECVVCTYSNPIHILYCEVCNKPKQSCSAAADSDKEGWSCPECTLQNGINDTQCIMCNALKPGTDAQEDVVRNPVKPVNNPCKELKSFKPNVDDEIVQGEGENPGDFSVIQRMIAAENEKKNPSRRRRPCEVDETT